MNKARIIGIRKAEIVDVATPGIKGDWALVKIIVAPMTYVLRVLGSGLETYELTISENSKWQTNRLKFVVPEGISQVNLKISSADGNVLIDDVNIVANKVAEHFLN